MQVVTIISVNYKQLEENITNIINNLLKHEFSSFADTTTRQTGITEIFNRPRD